MFLWRYTKYVLRHKLYVFWECCKLGIPLQGLTHDLSKFRPDEFFPYARHFYGKNAKQWRDKTGYYKPTNTGDNAFDFAWLLHQKRSPHHWQYWLLPQDQGGVVVIEMPMKYCKEMLADWRGAGKAQGRPDTIAWYLANRHKMLLGNETRAWIERQLFSLPNLPPTPLPA